ncbi:unnamed protein product, partial [Scytosiphon promiscuus]
ARTIEARFLIPYLTETTRISSAVFADADTVHDINIPNGISANSIQDDDKIRASAGASILWDSPVGPIRADFAYVIEKAEFDDEEVFRFGASTKF